MSWSAAISIGILVIALGASNCAGNRNAALQAQLEASQDALEQERLSRARFEQSVMNQSESDVRVIRIVENAQRAVEDINALPDTNACGVSVHAAVDWLRNDAPTDTKRKGSVELVSLP